MPFFNAPQTDEVLTADGTAAGFVTVTSNAAYYPGAFVWLHSDLVAAKRYQVVDVKSTGGIGLREVKEADDFQKPAAGPNYGRSSLAQWLTADNARISQQPSTVYVELTNLGKVSLIP